MNQKTTILNMLLEGNWVCTSRMYGAYIADPRKRLCELKKDGYELISRKCEQHDFHKGYSKEWLLMGKDHKIAFLTAEESGTNTEIRSDSAQNCGLGVKNDQFLVQLLFRVPVRDLT